MKPAPKLTAVNLHALASELREGGGTVDPRVKSTRVSHLRRCIAAGLLALGEDGRWHLTAAGHAAMPGWSP